MKVQAFTHNFAEAHLKAKEESKTVMMIFSGSDWSKSCKILRKTILESSTFKNYAKQHLVMLKLDFPSKKKNRLSKAQQKHNQQLINRYNPEGQFPLMLLLNQQGRIIHKMDYNAQLKPEDYISVIKKNLQVT